MADMDQATQSMIENLAKQTGRSIEQWVAVVNASGLEKSGSFNAMVTHRVRLAADSDIDAELIGWLRRAYDDA